MRIALVTRWYPPMIGGAEKVLSYLARGLAEAGAEVTVLTSQVSGRRLPVEEYPTRNLRVERLPTMGLRFLGTLRYMKALQRRLHREPWDVAYVSMLKHDAYVTVEVGRHEGFPVVLRPEGAGDTGDIAWQSWGRFGKRIAERTRQADGFVTISEAIRKELIADGYAAERIVDLPNGVPVPEPPWTPRSAGSPGSPRAVFVGRLAPEKGLDALIHAWPIVRKAFPAARLTLIGEGVERPQLEAIRDQLRLRDAVELPGANDDPQAVLREADLFVLPSHEEGMSIALLEAMGLGIPAVASDIPGNRALIDPGIHGTLAPPGDPERLAAAIVAAWSDRDGSLRQAAAARARVEEHYSVAAVARAHLELFERLIRERHR